MVDVAGCGHMAPLTHAQDINRWIVEFLDDDSDCGSDDDSTDAMAVAESA